MRTLLTGSAGYLGQRLYRPFLERGHEVVRTDLVPLQCDEPFVQADLVDYASVQRVMRDVDSMVIAHMAPRHEENPGVAFASSGSGAMNLFHAAAEAGVRNICLVSSVDATLGYPEDRRRSGSLMPRGRDVYGLTKVVQEHVAEHYARTAGLSVVVLRIGYVMDGETLVNKYGKTEPAFTPSMIDRCDVGEIACRFLERQAPGLSTFYALGALDHPRFDTASTWRALGWSPRRVAEAPLPAGEPA